jgi:transcriptional regulator GlxA family with amidase domain
VIPPRREGGQTQYLTTPVPVDKVDSRLGEVMDWARANLDSPLSINDFAARAHMSRRSFASHFKAGTGTTPHAGLLSQRINHAEELLDTTSLPIDQVAQRVGYRNPAVFREQFVRRRGVPPVEYRRAFSRTISRSLDR